MLMNLLPNNEHLKEFVPARPMPLKVYRVDLSKPSRGFLKLHTIRYCTASVVP